MINIYIIFSDCKVLNIYFLFKDFWLIFKVNYRNCILVGIGIIFFKMMSIIIKEGFDFVVVLF